MSRLHLVLESISCDIHTDNLLGSNPVWILVQVLKEVLLLLFPYLEPAILRLDPVQPKEIVVVLVLIELCLKLGMNRVFDRYGRLVQIILRKLGFLVCSEHCEVEVVQKVCYL